MISSYLIVFIIILIFIINIVIRYFSFIVHHSSFIFHYSFFIIIVFIVVFSTITIVISIINNIFKFSFAHVIPCFRNLRPQTATPNLKSQNYAHTCWYPVPPHVPSRCPRSPCPFLLFSFLCPHHSPDNFVKICKSFTASDIPVFTCHSCIHV